MISDLRQVEYLVGFEAQEVRRVIEVCIGEPGVRAIALLERAFEVATISVLEPFAGAMAA